MSSRERTIKLTDEVRDVLARSTVEGNTLTLPGELERKLYQQVDKALQAAGGKWNRKAGGHVFDGPPRERLGLDTGEVVDVRKTFQVYETPDDLAALMVERVGVTEGDEVLEPSCGSGRLVAAARARGAVVDAIEIRTEVAVDVLLRRGARTLRHADFLQVAPDEMGPYDVVLMNPPFTRGQDIEHVTHALRFLRPGGRLVAIVSGGVEWQEGKKAQAFRNLVSKLGGTIRALPAATFKDAGTSVNTALVVVCPI